MKLAIRVDGGGVCGLGHLQRMLALSVQVHAQCPEVQVVLLTRTPAACLSYALPGDMLIELPLARHDERAIEDFVMTHRPDVCVFDIPTDDYSSAFYPRLRIQTRVVRVDHPWADLASCDVLVLPDLHTDFRAWPLLAEFPDDRLLAGGAYVLLREEIAQAPVRPWGQRRHALVVAAGGVDHDQTLWFFHEAVRHLCLGTQEVQLLVPPDWQTPGRSWTIGHQCVWRRWTYAAIREAQLFMTTFGVSVYEALRAEVPVYVLSRTPTQMACAEQLEVATDGAVIAGPLLAEAQCHPQMLTLALQEQLDPGWLRSRQRACSGLIDGRGAHRVAAQILRLHRAG